MSRKDIIDAMQQCAQKLGRAPSLEEFVRLSGITLGKMRAHFRGIGEAIRAAGLDANPTGLRTGTRALLTDWGRVVRKLGSLPSRDAYRRHGQYSAKSFHMRFGAWALVPLHFLHFIQQTGIETQWQDVAGLIAHKLRLGRRSEETQPAQALHTARCEGNSLPVSGGEDPPCGVVFAPPHAATRAPLLLAPQALLPGRPVAGSPILLPGLGHEPANEAGVLFVFGMLADRLGFHVTSLQAGFPDCEAMRELQPGKWQHVRVEFEFESKAFKEHGHDPALCDVIVCWRHNWPECPAQLDVVELGRWARGMLPRLSL